MPFHDSARFHVDCAAHAVLLSVLRIFMSPHLCAAHVTVQLVSAFERQLQSDGASCEFATSLCQKPCELCAAGREGEREQDTHTHTHMVSNSASFSLRQLQRVVILNYGMSGLLLSKRHLHLLHCIF